MLDTINVAAQIKNVEVIEDLVYIRNIADSVAPFKAAYRTNKEVAVEACILWTLALMVKTRTSSPMINPKKMS